MYFVQLSRMPSSMALALYNHTVRVTRCFPLKVCQGSRSKLCRSMMARPTKTQRDAARPRCVSEVRRWPISFSSRTVDSVTRESSGAGWGIDQWYYQAPRLSILGSHRCTQDQRKLLMPRSIRGLTGRSFRDLTGRSSRNTSFSVSTSTLIQAKVPLDGPSFGLDGDLEQVLRVEDV